MEKVKSIIEVLSNKNVQIFLDDSGEKLRVVGDTNSLTKQDKINISDNKRMLIQLLEKSNNLNEMKFKRITPVTKSDRYSLSAGQRRLWVLSQLDEGAEVYNMPFEVVLKGEYDVTSFNSAISAVIDRHEILRTVFKLDDLGEVNQYIIPKEVLDFNLEYHDFRNYEDKKDKIKAYIKEDSYKAFDLENGPLLRASLLHLEDDEYVFYCNMHHIICDGWSMNVLSKEILNFYEIFKNNKEFVISPLRIQYKDYASWQLSNLEELSNNKDRDYWLNELSGELPVIDLPSSKLRPSIKTHKGHSFKTYLSKSTTKNLRNFSQQQGGSLFISLLSTWNVLLYKYTSDQDIVIGSPVAGRDHEDLVDQIGFYVNTLALRNTVNPEESFISFYDKVKKSTLSSFDHQMYPFDRLIEDLDLKRDVGRNAIFDIMLVLQNAGSDINEFDISEHNINKIEDLGNTVSKYDIELSFQEVGDCLSFQVIYNTDVYDGIMINNLIHHFKQLLDNLLLTPKEKIGSIDFLTQEEKRELLYDFNATSVIYPNDKTIVDLFKEQITKTPDAIALAFKGRTLTYRELDEDSNSLANYLLSNYKIEKENIIGIKLDRSEWFVISILSILKLGAAYVPIDPNYPNQIMSHIEEDSNCKIIIDDELLNTFKRKENSSKVAPNIDIDIRNLAYVIYTSGSTGKPKGVMIEHRGIVNTILSSIDILNLKGHKRGLLFASFSFDASIFEIFIVLLSGASLHIAGEEERNDPKLLESFIEYENIDIATISPSYLKLMDIQKIQGLKTLITAGESAVPDKVSEFLNWGTFYNGYGPTEVSICASIFKIDKGCTLMSNNIPIGSPISNAQIYIIDENNSLVPKEVIGEICIGGPGLARGYLNRSELTDEKFIPHPFKQGERVYKTGDLGRWLPNGNVEFIGRKDDQVKIRGHRIELGEIENALLKLEQIDNAIVLVKEYVNNEKELIAYIISSKKQNTSDLRKSLKNTLSDYMLPSHYIQLEEFPLTPNGKLNKKALLKLNAETLTSNVEYIAPRNEIEKQLVTIWEEVIGTKKIGVMDDFFDLGGHSLKAVNMLSRVNKVFDVRIDFTLIFRVRCISELAQLIANMLWDKKQIETSQVVEKITI
ncbi:non-ribosomal peptide synthetase [Aquimarina sp. AU119]|uniref:non-ribosomal peptide synthetase n=1 Tax=Aquimarina sp. AU119 TaxID=2108528 RepID=UPI000D6950AC|nr:non-ribosomal peptide synthetase [Aquimarina sp. AU119]